ncbi:MAG: N-acetylglucosamine-6-phosphate deacetylase [Verrucomicrobia bacterium]|nr:N-acetylglucosamine-6-phosphate deacetylase [Verrucomicrobiota bacterium]
MSYFDLQINGYAGVDFCSHDLTSEEMRRACEALAADGIGGILATLITDSVDALCAKLGQMVRYREEDPFIRETVRGFHVEGPFLNAAPGYIGAHPPQHVVPANSDDAARILEAGNGLVRLMTLAPENDAGAATTRFLVSQGVTVSAGHCDPDLGTLERAIDAGLSMITHLGSGCPVVLPRHDNFIQRVLSLSDRLWVCFIPDGAHVPFFALKNYLRITGLERTIFTSDAILAAGLGPGIYHLSGEPVEVDAEGVARRPGSPNLAGSTIRGHQVARNLREHLGLSEAGVDRVYRDNPMRALGFMTHGLPAEAT